MTKTLTRILIAALATSSAALASSHEAGEAVGVPGLVGTLTELEDAKASLGAAGDGQFQAGLDDVPESGGARSVGAQLAEDDAVKETVFRFDSIQRGLAPYFDWKRGLEDEHNLALGMDYTGLYYGASGDLGGEDSAGSGNFRLFGTWTPLKSESGNTGSVVFKVEDRHAYGDVPVSGLGFETGTVGLLGPPFNDSGFLVSNLFWMHKLNDGRTTILAGVIDVTDYLDVYGLINPWTHFSNLVFSTGGASIPAPNQGLGAAFGNFFSDNAYFTLSLADTNGDPTDLGDSFDSFFSDNEYFTSAELGWVSSFEERYLNNTHVVVWHADEREEAGVPDGWGVNFSWAHFYGSSWLPFLRAGYADDGGALLETSVTGGVGHYMSGRGDLLGLGLNWGEPSEDFGADLDEQVTAELFYRLQLSQNFAVTPDVQYVMDPALNPSEDSIWYFGLRARLSL